MTTFSDAGWSPDMHAAMWMARAEARALHVEMFDADLRITSGMRPQSPGGSSLHPRGRAMDVGVKFQREDGSWYHMTRGEQRAYARRLQAILGEDFDVVLEGPHALNPRYRNRVPHVHIEYDPKGRHAQRLVED